MRDDPFRSRRAPARRFCVYCGLELTARTMSHGNRRACHAHADILRVDLTAQRQRDEHGRFTER